MSNGGWGEWAPGGEPTEVDTIVLEPDWENTTRYFAQAFKQGAFEKNAKEPIVSFIEQVRYLAITDPEALERILTELKR